MAQRPRPFNPLGPRGRLLIVDDDAALARALESQLRSAGFDASVSPDAATLRETLRVVSPDAIILDHSLPDAAGIDLVPEIQRHDPSIAVVVLSGTVEVEDAVHALRAGAEDVLTKPPVLDLLLAALDRGLARTQLMRSQRLADTQVADPYGLLDDSPAMQRVRRLLDAVARSGFPALLVGETGTGKGALAAMLHQMSPLATQPLVRLEVGGRPEAEFERDLAALLRPDGKDGPGLLARPAGGTLFLTRVGLMPDRVQALLAALLDPRARGTLVPAHLRIIAATKRDLAADVQQGVLRADVEQRLGVMPIHVPSLRDRGADAVLQIARRTIARHHLLAGEGPRALSEGAERVLTGLEWPGNARQLQAVLEEAFALALDSESLEERHLRRVIERRGLGASSEPGVEDLSLRAVEKKHIERVLARTGGNRAEAARLLGITRTTLYKKVADYNLDIGR